MRTSGFSDFSSAQSRQSIFVYSLHVLALFHESKVGRTRSMAPRWLFWLSYMTTFPGFHICGADLDNATNTPRSATKALNEPLNLTEVLDGVDSDIPAYCNGSNSWIKFKASQIVPNCRAAEFMLKSSKIWLWGHTEYEFLPRGVPARLEFPVMRTPLRVTSSIVPSQSNLWKVGTDRRNRHFLAVHHSDCQSEHCSSSFSQWRRDKRTLSEI